MVPNRRSRSSAALVAAVGALVLGSAASAVAADLAPGFAKDGMFREGAFAQEVAPGGADLVSAAMSAVRAAAGIQSSPFAAAEPGAISAAAALLGGTADDGAFAGETGGFDRLQSVGYGGEGGLMANSGLPPNIQPTNPARKRAAARFAGSSHPVLAAIAAAKGWFGGGNASFAAPVGVGAYDAVRDAASDIGGPAESGLMSDGAFSGTLEPAAIRAAAADAATGRIGFSAPNIAFAALLGSGEAAFAAGADAGTAARLREAAVSAEGADDAFSAPVGASAYGREAAEAMRALIERAT